MISEEQEKLSKSLRQQIKEHHQKYFKISQMALYRNLDVVEKLKIFTKSSCDVKCNIIFCYDSHKYRSELKEQIHYYIVRTLNDEIPKMKNKFSIAYVHNSISDFIIFRNYLRILPQKILCRLGILYLIDVGLLVKIIEKFSFGAINNYFDQKIEYVQRIQDIEEQHKITLGGQAVIKSKLKMKEPQEIEQEIASLDVPTDIIRNGFYGKQITEYPLGAYQIPKIIQLLIGRLYSQNKFLKMQGIMRKSCDVEELQVLEGHILKDSDPSVFISSYNECYVLGGCVKKIFNNLQSPLFSYSIYQMIVSYRTDGIVENDIKFARTCIESMAKPNRLVLAYMTAFLIKGIILYSEYNKMNAYNLAVVFGPCFFRPKKYRLEDLMNSGKFSFIIKMLLDNYQKIFGEETAIKYFNILEEQKEKLNNN